MTNKEAIKHFSVIRSAMKHCDELRDDIRDCIEDDPIELIRVAINALEKTEKYRRHDLRKNPNDLPSGNWDEKLVLHVKYITSTRRIIGRYIRGSFTTFDGTKLIGQVIAWREIEPFEECVNEY